MLRDLLSAGLLLAVCVTIHALAVITLLRWLSRRPRSGQPGFWRSTWLLICIAWWVVLAHVVEVICWAVFYGVRGAFPDPRSCVYFSIVTYTTTGYGDLVPPVALRLTAGVEGLTGILLCGWSAGFFFAVVDKMYRPLGGVAWNGGEEGRP